MQSIKNQSDLKYWLPFLLLPLAAVLLMPREHSGKMAVTALVLTVLFGMLVMNLRQIKIQRGSSPA